MYGINPRDIERFYDNKMTQSQKEVFHRDVKLAALSSNIHTGDFGVPIIDERTLDTQISELLTFFQH